MLKDILYNLKQEYGRFCALYRTTSVTPNFSTGRVITSYQVVMIDRAIVLPVNIARKFSVNALFGVDKVEFPMGGMYDILDRVLILDGPSAEYGQDDYAIIDRMKYQIQKLDSDNMYYLKALRGTSPYTQTVQNLLKNGQVISDRVLIALDEYVRTLSNADLMAGYHTLICGQDPKFDLLGVGTLTTSATYREVGLKGGILLPTVTITAPAQDLTDFGVNFHCYGACTLTSSELVVGPHQLEFGTYSWTPTVELVGSIFVTSYAGVLSIYKNGVLVHTADVSTITGSNGASYVFTGNGYLRAVYIGKAVASIHTAIKAFNRRLGRDVD